MGVLHFPVDRLGCWSERLAELDVLGRFELVTCQEAADGMELSLVIEASGGDVLRELMNSWLAGERHAGRFAMEDQVDLIFLHGPHFQDRFGIADTAFSALASHNIPIRLSGCAGTSMYLVFAGGAGSRALKILNDTFLIPTTL